ncbi:MAG TPA: DNA ligase D, partial [Thermoanaerobaculia bacterium]|nr:DNA ligase D [Thermoanaerobaculia bacterium]
LAASSEDVLRYNDHVEGQGEAFYRQACKLGVEGIVAKRRDAPYRSGRGGDWLKVKCLARQELVIGGFTAPQGSRSGLGALLVGVYRDRKLRFAGKVGTGFDAATLADLTRRLKPLARATPPFDDPPRGAEARGVTWVDPELVAEVAFTEWTDDGRLRHPSFQGLREDKPAREVEQEKPAPVTASTSRSGKARKARKEVPAAASRKTIRNPAPEKGEPVVAGVTLSHPERVLYAEQGVTKLDLALYYQAVERFILPHLAGRPLTLVRCPQGRQKGCFYQKHLGEGMPAAVRSVAIREGDGGEEPYPYVEDLAGLVSLVQIGVLELHGWGASAGDLERPDRLVFDLDPDPAVPWPRVVQAAQLVRKGLAEIGLACFVQTTGGKGLHVVAPLSRRRSWPEIKEFARAFAEGIVRGAPDLYVSKASKAARAGKIFIDWLRNARGATAILPYSTRARPGATVATPLAWAELPGVHPDELTVETVPARLAKLRKDPWGDFPTARQTIRAETFRALGL